MEKIYDMCNSINGCCKSGCTLSLIGKILLIIGGVNWGLVGVGILLDSNWNVINLILGSIPTLEGIVYLLVGIAAVMNIFGCKCKKCVEACASYGTGDKTGGTI